MVYTPLRATLPFYAAFPLCSPFARRYVIHRRSSFLFPTARAHSHIHCYTPADSTVGYLFVRIIYPCSSLRFPWVTPHCITPHATTLRICIQFPRTVCFLRYRRISHYIRATPIYNLFYLPHTRFVLPHILPTRTFTSFLYYLIVQLLFLSRSPHFLCSTHLLSRTGSFVGSLPRICHYLIYTTHYAIYFTTPLRVTAPHGLFYIAFFMGLFSTFCCSWLVAYLFVAPTIPHWHIRLRTAFTPAPPTRIVIFLLPRTLLPRTHYRITLRVHYFHYVTTHYRIAVHYLTIYRTHHFIFPTLPRTAALASHLPTRAFPTAAHPVRLARTLRCALWFVTFSRIPAHSGYRRALPTCITTYCTVRSIHHLGSFCVHLHAHHHARRTFHLPLDTRCILTTTLLCRCGWFVPLRFHGSLHVALPVYTLWFSTCLRFTTFRISGCCSVYPIHTCHL